MSEFDHDKKLRQIKTPIKSEIIETIKAILLTYGVTAKYVTGYQENLNGTSYTVCVKGKAEDVENICIETSQLYQESPRSLGPFIGKGRAQWLVNPNYPAQNIFNAEIVDKASRPWDWNPDGSIINSFHEKDLVYELEDLLVKSRTNPKLLKEIEKSIRELKKKA